MYVTVRALGCWCVHAGVLKCLFCTCQCYAECQSRHNGVYNMTFTGVDVLTGDARVKFMSIVDFSVLLPVI